MEAFFLQQIKYISLINHLFIKFNLLIYAKIQIFHMHTIRIYIKFINFNKNKILNYLQY